jgi:hypothetical protein
MIKRTVAALALVAVAAVGTASAQQGATFTLRSGEKLSGELMDMGGAGFTARINGQERQFSTNDVAVIDFTGAGANQADWDRLSSGQVIVLKDGQTLNGQLTDVGGSSPLRLSFSINGANRDFTSNDVARIILSRPADAPAPAATVATSGTTPVQGGFAVSGQTQWTPTSITVRRGDTLTVTASGNVKISPTAADNGIGGAGETNAGNPVPSAPTGALIGRIGNSRPFVIGTMTRVQAPAAGQLFLGINDSYVGDNQGAFQVQIVRGAQ